MKTPALIARHVCTLILAAASAVPAGAAGQEAGPGDDPGSGLLLARVNGGLVPMPMLSMNVELSVSGPMVRSRLRQTFTNPTAEALEAIYVFPLPEGAAVDELRLRVGDRFYTGRIEEIEEAQRTYEQAKSDGKQAGLVEQQRPNMFRIRVANIAPEASVTVDLGLLDEAEWGNGEYSTVFPLAITSRYSPVAVASESTSLADSVSNLLQPFSSPAAGTRASRPEQSTASTAASPHLADSVPAGSTVTIYARIDAGVPLADVSSPSHAIHVTPRDGGAIVQVGIGPVAADRDFVLRWRPVAGTSPAAGGLVEDRADGRYGLAMLVPPAAEGPAAKAGQRTQTVFVVDVSGSMDGPSLEQAKAALVTALDRLRPGDTFTLIKFATENSAYSERFQPSDPGTVSTAKRWVQSLRTEGGTEILPALLRALRLSESGDARALRRVVLITDGAVDNEEQVLTEVGTVLGSTRLHIVGIGFAPNRWLMKELARTGRGTFESIGSIADVQARTTDLLERTERPVITDVTLEWEGAEPLDASPLPVPDLYAGRPLVVTARFDPSKPLPKLRVTGWSPDGPVTMDVDFRSASPDAGIGTRWARARIADLESTIRHGAEPAVVRSGVVQLAKQFSLVTAYTSFVVVADDAHAFEGECDDGESEPLPMGGTFEPLLFAIGATLTAAGAALAWAARRTAHAASAA